MSVANNLPGETHADAVDATPSFKGDVPYGLKSLDSPTAPPDKAGRLPKRLIDALFERFDDRVSFDPIECELYSTDVGVFPRPIRFLAPGTVAEAVVRPRSEEELAYVFKLSREHRVAVTPRGRQTSGYGGAVPTRRGIVLDMSEMHGKIRVDAENKTVSCGPGWRWEEVDARIGKEGLALRTYPSSYQSSTVGGWVAQGGAGYGGYAHGTFRDSLVAVRVVRPDGTIEDLVGAAVDDVYGAMGTTGLITRVTFRVRNKQDMAVFACSFDDAAGLAKALTALTESEAPVESVHLINPTMGILKNKRPLPQHHGHEVERHGPKAPESYVLVVAGLESNKGHVAEAAADAANEGGGTILPDEIAAHEWEDRFALMSVKRLGPSLVPTEGVVPLSGLGGALTDIEKKVKLPAALEGMVVKTKSGYEIVVLGLIPHDERTLRFTLAYPASLTVLGILKKNGGRAYAAGPYFPHEGPAVFGARWDSLRKHKAAVDPEDLLNPDKLKGKGAMPLLTKAAAAMEPLARPFANMAKIEPGERFRKVKGLPDDVAHYAYACAQCGVCIETCDEYYGRGWESHSPRGKWRYLKMVIEGKAKWDQEWVTRILSCTTCELCVARCPLDLPIEPSWLKLRGQLVQDEGFLTFPPFEMMAASLYKEGNIWASFRKDRDQWVPDEIAHRKQKKDAKVCYFAGCTASYVEQDIAQGTAMLLDKAGVDFTLLGQEENCCGIPMLVSGKWQAWEDNMRKNIDAMNRSGADTIVTSCPACYLVWKTIYPDWAKKLGIEYDFETKHYSEVLVDSLRDGTLDFDEKVCRNRQELFGATNGEPLKVTWHDSCHMGRAAGVYEEPRELIQAVPGVEFVEMEHNRENGLCCGSVLTLIGDPPTAHKIGDHRLQEAVDAGAQHVLAACPCCQFQLRVSADKMDTGVQVHDLAHFIGCNLGMELVDPTPYAITMWAVFEQVVMLMRPEGMANLMKKLFPELVSAMPAPMKGMMKAVKAMPAPLRDGMLAMMKPMMPILFPKLLPGMMPKVMPEMLAEVEKQIPMPDHMREQMPEIMPQVMDSIMPNMLPKVVPLVVEPFIEHVRNHDIN